MFTLIGYVQDKSLFHQAGIELCGGNQQPQVNLETMESNVPGIYVAGTAFAGTQSREYRLFLENCHQHVNCIVSHLTGEPDRERQRMIEDAPES